MKREDLFEAIGEADPELLADCKKKAIPWKPYVGATAACLVLLGSLALWKPAAQPPLDEPPMQTDIPAVQENTDTQSTAPTSPEVPSISFVTPKDAVKTAYDIALPKGYFFYTMTAQDIGSIFGLEKLDSLGGYPLSGQVIYDGNGDAWAVHLFSDTDPSFTIELAPGHLPYECVVVQEEKLAMDYNGTTLYALNLGDSLQLSALYEGTETVGLRASGSDQAALEELAQLAFGGESGLQLSQLHTEDIPPWRSEQLDESAARAEEGFTAYLPTVVPERFSYRMGYRELGQNRDYLTLDYESSGIYGYLAITVEKIYDDLPMIDAANLESYDRSDYAHGGAVPEEYYDTWSRGVFRAEDVTPERVAARCSVDPEGALYCDLRVLYPDGTLVSISGGITAQEAYDLIAQIG